LVAEGYRVHALARRKEKLDELRDALGEGLIPVVGDVSDTSALVAQIRQIDEDCGGLELVIANAGIGMNRPATKLSWESWVEPVLQINVLGAIATLTAVLPKMVERDRGQLVGISSIAAMRGLPQTGAYSASKAALSTFLETLRIDLAGTGLSVTTIEPGFVKTPLTDKNKSPMPFLMELDDAVAIMRKAILKRKSFCSFPWQLATLGKVGRVTPRCLYERVASK